MEETIINGYRLNQSWELSGNARWCFAEKGGAQWFIKEFYAPKLKTSKDGYAFDIVAASIRACDVFNREKQELYARVKKAYNGNIVPVEDFFMEDSCYYAVSQKIEPADIRPDQVVSLPERQRLVLMKVLCDSLAHIHEQGVVHADIKPENVMIKKTSKAYTLKLIDFDSSFLIENPPVGEAVPRSFSYTAPETVCAQAGVDIRLNEKLDIYALGLMLHLLYCGELPKVPEECKHIYEAYFRGGSIELNSGLPTWLKYVIEWTLHPDTEQRPSAAQMFTWLTEMDCSPVPKKVEGEDVTDKKPEEHMDDPWALLNGDDFVCRNGRK